MTATGAHRLDASAHVAPAFRRWIVLVGVFALAVHLACLTQACDDPTFDRPILDSQTYHRQALRIARGGPSDEGVFREPPLYPYWLGGVYRVAGPRIGVAKLLQALVGTGTCLLAWSLASRVFGPQAGPLAGILTALSGPLVFLNVQLLPAVWVVFLNMLALRLLVWSLDRPRWYAWFATGLTIGLAALATPNVLIPLAALQIGFVVVGIRRRSWTWPTAALLCAAGTAASIAPVTIRNVVAGGEFVFIAANGGANFFIGNNPDADRTTAIRPGGDWVCLVTMPALEAGIESPAAIDAYFYRSSLAYLREQPGAFARNMAVKAFRFINGREIPRTLDVYLHRDYSTLLKALTWRWHGISYPFGLVAPLAVLGAVVAWKRHPASRLLLAYVALYGGSVILFFVTARYRQPIVPVISGFAAVGILWLARAWHEGRTARLVPAGGLLLIVGLVVNLPMRDPSDRVNFAAEMHHLLGVSWQQEEKFDEAERELRISLAIEPHDAEALVSLGLLMLQRGQPDDARRAFTDALAQAPAYPQAHFGRGMLAIQERNFQEAADHFAEAVRLMPTRVDTRQRLAACLMELGRPADAADQLQEVLRRTPDNRNARRLLALALLEMGERAAAEAHARQLLASDPNDATALRVLEQLAARRATEPAD